MNYWWVNHKQTFKQEFEGGYLWSPKTKKNGARNPFYEYMREVKPGDCIFSYAFGLIQGIGIAKTHCYTCPRPDEFGHVGVIWDIIGWRVDVDFTRSSPTIKPSEHIEYLLPFIPEKHSPLNSKGDGYQHVYLTIISENFAQALANILGPDISMLIQQPQAVAEESQLYEIDLPGLSEWEENEQTRIIENAAIDETERKALIKARKGQGIFKENVYRFERYCRITGVENPTHLIASHIKPWRDSNNEERLTGDNGLLLTPSIDHLFDRGFISFEDEGELLVSSIADRESLKRMGIQTDKEINTRRFNSKQSHFLEYHRKNVFLKSAAQ